MIIHIPLKRGCKLSHDVIRGIALNDCYPVISTNIYAEKDKSIFENWTTLINGCKEEFFLGMDADTVLEENTIKDLLEELKTHDMVIYPQAGKSGESHGTFGCRVALLQDYPLHYYGEGKCPWCFWFADNGKLLKIKFMNKFLKEIPNGNN